jgi:hypothetical protein
MPRWTAKIERVTVLKKAASFKAAFFWACSFFSSSYAEFSYTITTQHPANVIHVGEGAIQ